jgi:hypothetical protein
MDARVTLTGDLIEAFSGMYLSPRYDRPRATAEFHRVAWQLYASTLTEAGCIAPRDHAKSTALTFDYSLAETLFKCSDYVIIIGSTEEMAQEQLSNISEELHENEDLARDFGPFLFETDQKTEIIVRLPDGHRFRILARGAEQKIRGRMWKGKRPNLIICDDMEDDEQVENLDRRRKFRRWFFRAAKQALAKGGKIRIHGTILHEDSLLNRLRKQSGWKLLYYKAHAAFDDFSNILWPERWSETELRRKRQEFIDDNDAAGYSQEFLNDPIDLSEAYLRKEDFIPMEEDDHAIEKRTRAAWDFALSERQTGDNSSCTVGGKDARNLLHIVDQRKGHWQAPRLIDEIFAVQERWDLECQYVENDVIWKAIKPLVYKEMQIRDVWVNFVEIPSVKSKSVRGRILQRRHKGGGMRFDKEAGWYPEYEFELLRITEGAEALRDDQFDSTSLLCRGFEEAPEVEDEDFDTEEEAEFRHAQPPRGHDKPEGWRTGYN